MCHRVAVLLALCFTTVAVGCNDTNNQQPQDPDAAVDAAPPPSQVTFGGDRPVELLVPDDYDHSEPTPLLIVLHGYSANGSVQLSYTGLDTIVNGRNVLVAAPDGTVDSGNNRFWNATDACCDFANTNVDDLGYISGLITEISGVWNVDPQRVFLFGHSNGAFMSYQLACHHADKIAGVAALAGVAQLDVAVCNPSEPVNILHIHGDQDETIPYEGRSYMPSADATAKYWAGYNGCASTRTLGDERIDIDQSVVGAETRIERHDGCPEGVSVHLWTLEGGSHVPAVAPAEFAGYVWDWLSGHAKR